VNAPPPTIEEFLRALRRELRPLGLRRRRNALAEARDHLLSMVEDEVEAGVPHEIAERSAIARFGEHSEIAARLCSVRPRRGRRVVPALVGAAAITALIALAAGPVGDKLTPHTAAASAIVSPSENDCAQAFDRPANETLRTRIADGKATRIQIFATTAPSCVIKFEQPGRRVVTVEAAWRPRADLDWKSTSSPNGNVAGTNAVWQGSQLRADGPNPNQTQELGPAPTISSCIISWNASPPTLPHRVTGSPPVYVEALNGGISISGGGSTTSIRGDACAVSVVRSTHHALFLVAPWHRGQAASWSAPVDVDGLVAGAAPNSKLQRDGLLETPAPTSTPKSSIPVSPPSATPRISRQMSATGWAGGIKLHQSLAQAIARFGKPSGESVAGFTCQVSWAKIGLTATFLYAHPLRNGTVSKVASCGTTLGAQSFTGADTWATTAGLAVGMPESEVLRHYPGAGHSTDANGTTTWYLVPRSGTPSQTPLTATTSAAGTVASLTVGAGADGSGTSTTTFGVVVWGKKKTP
jgi:hypothetical protein